MLKVYNTLDRKLEEFKPLEDHVVKFYQCGPTVYWNQHIGNMRAMVMADLVRRSLTQLGYDVKFVRNYTDFGHLTGDNIGDADTGEDRVEKSARREGVSPKEIADRFIAQFEKDTNELNIIEPDVKARATDYIDSMIKMVQTLLDKGYAYVTPKAIYFDVSKFPDYTKLSGRKLDKDKAGSGFGDVSDSNKKNPADFAVWFFRTGPHASALQYWPSPFKSPEVPSGEGFPGWHIECSAMVLDTLGKTIDLHMGGVEHISIHHTNEIAQSEAANGVKFVNYWLHNEHLLVDGKKMAKSEGTGFLVDEIIEKGFDPIHIRYLFLQAHYRSKQNFTWESLNGAKNAYQRLLGIYSELLLDQNSSEGNEEEKASYRAKFNEALEDDFNLPQALASVWEMIDSDISKISKRELIEEFDKVLGLKISENSQKKKEVAPEVKEKIEKLIQERNDYRKSKDWAKADEIRKKLNEEFDVEIEDKGELTEWAVR